MKIMLLIINALNKKPTLPSLRYIIFLKEKLFARFQISSFCSLQTHIQLPLLAIKDSVAWLLTQLFMKDLIQSSEIMYIGNKSKQFFPFWRNVISFLKVTLFSLWWHDLGSNSIRSHLEIWSSWGRLSSFLRVALEKKLERVVGRWIWALV